jgi:hypothetical protein
MGEMKNEYKILVGKTEGKKPHGRHRHIKMDLREVGWEGVDWTFVAQDRDQWQAVVNAIMSHQVP